MRERGELEKARSEYIDALAADSSTACAVRGLKAIALDLRAEERLCKIGKGLAENGQEEGARRRYVAALGRNPASACASEGLAPKAEEKDKKGWVERTTDDLANLVKLVAVIVTALLVLVGIGLLIATMWRRRKASLTIEPFAHDAVDPKVGGAVAALVEKRLTDLSRQGRKDDSFMLDVVVADVELLASNESLETALGGLAEASQFTLAVAVLSLIDRMFGTHLIAKGELAPAGADGHGVMVALQARNGLLARGALWDSQPLPPPPAGGAEVPPDPDPYYKLAEPAAAWLQYETACSLDSRVGLMTESAKSFSLLSQGLVEHRNSNVDVAADRYAEALAVDPENVAALVNMSAILARHHRRFIEAIGLLLRAWAILESRYEETR